MIRLQLSIDGSVYRRPGESLKDPCVVKNMKHPIQQMIWGVVSSKGIGDLHFVDGFMNGEKYAKLVDDVIEPQMVKWFKVRRRFRSYVFMHDLAPCHRSKVANERFKYHKIPMLEWPSNAPDLNPIENVWRTLKILVRKRIIRVKARLLRNCERITDKEILRQSIAHVWFNSKILREISAKCCASVKKRVEEIKKAKGQWTKY